MKQLNKISIIIIICLLGAVNCKKYEDGPLISLRTKKARLCKIWKLENSTFPPNGLEIGYFPIHIFEKDGTYKKGIDIFGVEPTIGTWKFNENKEKIITEVNNSKDTFSILRLTEKELWFYWSGYNNNIFEDQYIPYK